MNLSMWSGIVALFTLICACQSSNEQQADNSETTSQSDSLEAKPQFRQTFEMDNRKIEIWLPPSYFDSQNQRYPVLYMHDGQNIFDSATAYGGEEWGIDENLSELIENQEAREAIVVGIWNAQAARTAQYIPQKMLAKLSLEGEAQKAFYSKLGAKPFADDYLKFLVSELKPYIDKEFRTQPDANNTFMMGSSMGGLISIYGLMEYPDVFGAVACVSTHWALDAYLEQPALPQAMIDYVDEHLPAPGKHKIYFDFGTKTLDSLYEVHQIKIDEIMRKKGYQANQDWVTLKFEGAEHNEVWWRKRVKIPLKFLLGK